MNQDHVVGKVKVIGKEMIVVSNNIGYQYSAKLYFELDMDQAKGFSGMLLNAVCKSADLKTISCPILEEDGKRYILLIEEIFKEEGVVKLSLGGINSDKIVVTTNCIELYIDESNILTDITSSPAEEYWQMLVKKTMEYWFLHEIQPLFDQKNQDLKELKETVDSKVKQLNDKLEHHEFDGRTILGGSGEPDPALGVVGDYYINQSSTGDYAYYIYQKQKDGWKPLYTTIGRDGDNRNLFGESYETAVSKIPFYHERTLAQITADQRNIELEEDLRIPSIQVKHKDVSLNIYLDDISDKLQISSMNEAGSINARGKDLNTLVKTGFYRLSENCLNLPYAGLWDVDVKGIDTDFCHQIAYLRNQSHISMHRCCNNGEWSIWNPMSIQFTGITLKNNWVGNGQGSIVTRIGNIVWLHAVIRYGKNEANTVVANIPEGYRPVGAGVGASALCEGGVSNVGIMPTGDIILYQPVANAGSVYITAMWMV